MDLLSVEFHRFDAVWKQHVGTQYSEFVVIALGTFLIHELSWLLFNLPYIVLDEFKLGERWRLQPGSRVSSEVRWTLFKRLVKGHFLELLPLLCLAYPLLKFVGFSSNIDFPTPKEFFIQMLVFNVIEDTGFYWVHRWLHTPWAYAKIHKVHHEYTAPISLTGEIAHPAEFFFNFLVPLMAGPFLIALISGLHIATFWAWICFREMRSTDAHSGYNLPFHPLRLLGFIYGGPKMHDFHHQIHGRQANFGGYKFWDWLMGTDKKYHEYQQKQQQQQKKL